VFVCNAVSLIFIIVVLVRWKRVPPSTALPPERFWPAILTGLRFTRHSPALQATIYRSVGFYFFASVMWALLPLIALDLLEGDERTYGRLFAAISVGAIGSAFLLPTLRRVMNNDQLITRAGLVFAAGIGITATVHNHLLAMLALCICGAAWITVMTGAQMSAQTALPTWVKSRGIAIFQTFFMGSLAIGPAVWGGVAEITDLPTSMLIASGCLVVSSLFTRRWPLSGNDQLDHMPSKHWQAPELKLAIDPHQGPVMIAIRYEPEPAHVTEFLREIHLLGKARQRDGSIFWEIFEDATNPGSFLETYVVNTWLDHLRQHERISKQDAQIQARIRALLRPDTAPVVTQFVKPTS
jgi:quinol monooxygenase YgiN